MHYYWDKDDLILKNWVQGIGAQYLPYEEIIKTPVTNAISFRSLAKRKVIYESLGAKRPFYYIDTGYVGNLIKKKIWHRVVKNDLQHTKIFDCPDDRWKRIIHKSPELDFIEWRKNHNGKILLVTPSEKPCKFYNIDRDQWVEETITELKKHTDKEIIIRDKGKRYSRVGQGSIPWYLIREKIYAVVTYQSIAAIESICVGVPAFTTQNTAADSLTLKDLSKIESPLYADPMQVKKWQHWLAYCQYHYRELGSGEAWRIMERYGLT